MRIAVSGRMPGNEQWVNVWHTTTAFTPEFTDQAVVVLRNFYTALESLMATSWRLDKYVGSDQTPGGSAPVEITETTVVGTSAGTPLPNQCALVVSWRSLFASRRTRGRTYLGGFTTTNFSGSGTDDLQGASALITTIRDAANTLQLSTTPTFGVYSRINGTVTPFSGGYVNSRIDTQRRRGKTPIRIVQTF